MNIICALSYIFNVRFVKTEQVIFGLAFSIDNFLSAFLGALIVSVVGFILSRVIT